MKFKLDENIGLRGLALLTAAGHDATTVSAEGLSGTSDSALLEVATKERRVLIKLDHHFGQVLRFPPHVSAGSVVLEPGPRATSRMIEDRIREFLTGLDLNAPAGRLWIVEPGRVRIHQARDPSDE